MSIPRPKITSAVAALSIAAFSQTVAAQAMTRQEVRQELVRARHDGVIPSPNHDYSASPATVARNQEIHRSTVHRGEKAPMVDAHDNRLSGARRSRADNASSTTAGSRSCRPMREATRMSRRSGSCCAMSVLRRISRAS
ncbi:DUF4148 domain-containing protein [Burkholderia pyrrocinia]|uniref:DUF4148 domain-containing protein n=1 Tax=Burkholderia pyrrocinia TaxID=60550 RepID=UPI003BB07BE7